MISRYSRCDLRTNNIQWSADRDFPPIKPAPTPVILTPQDTLLDSCKELSDSNLIKKDTNRG